MKHYKWYNCPTCGKKLLKIHENSIIRDVKVWCKSCKQEIELNLEPKSQ